MAAGNVKREFYFFVLAYSKNATAAISKGDIVTLNAGRSWATGDKGPYGVAISAIASGADMRGKVLEHGVVTVLAGGAISQFVRVYPSATAKVSATGEAGSLALGDGQQSASQDSDEIDVLV